MHFLNPSAFYLLAFIPIVAFLHFLKLRRQRLIVPSVMLWLEAVEDMKANVPFQKLQNSFLLPLQILFLLIVIAGVARPALRQPGALTDQSIVIIDTSTSMLATDSGKSRLDAAKAEALKRINQLDANGNMMIMDTSPPSSNVLQAFTSDKEKLRLAVKNLSVRHGPPSLKAAFDSAQIYGNLPNTRVFFISDNCRDLPFTAQQISLHCQEIALGNSIDNVGIVRFSAARDTHQSSLYRILVVLQNFAESPRQVQVRLEIEGRWVDDETVTIEPRATKSIVFVEEDEGFDGQTISARLVNVDDDLAVDDAAYAILQPPPEWKILLVSDREQPLLTTMLETNPYVVFSQIRTEEYHGTADRDFVIFDGFVPKLPLNGNAIFLNPVVGLPFMPAQSSAQSQSVIYQNQTHPVMRNVSLLGLNVRKSLICEMPIWGIPLAETAKSPLIWLGTQIIRSELPHGNNTKKVIVFTFDPFDLDVSRFALFDRSIASAPILLAQCFEWLDAATAPIQPDVVKAGEPVKFHLDHPENVVSATLLMPDNTSKDLAIDDSTFLFTETFQIGVYSLYINGRPLGKFAVNLLDAAESDLSLGGQHQAAEGVEDGGTATVSQYEMQGVNQELWGFAAIAALLLLVVEWWFYHRNLRR
ncbi:MAG: BatA and WFA domain-containing protein [Candidatus Poribacteria bacterium]|nr:BatA and WFA domain-containing protein [Candidatus Poribacteria bacterium]